MSSVLWPPPRMPCVTLLGTDGSGKSSVLREIEKAFAPPRTAGVKIIHRSDLTGHKGSGVVAHYEKPAYGLVLSVAKLAARALQWLLAYWGRVAAQRQQGYLVVFDRHYLLDLCVDPLRYRYGGPAWLVRWVAGLLPQPEIVILLDAPAEVLLARKQEVSPEEMARQRQAYLQLARSLPGSHVVDAALPLEQVVRHVTHLIEEKIQARLPQPPPVRDVP